MDRAPMVDDFASLEDHSKEIQFGKTLSKNSTRSVRSQDEDIPPFGKTLSSRSVLSVEQDSHGRLGAFPRRVLLPDDAVPRHVSMESNWQPSSPSKDFQDLEEFEFEAATRPPAVLSPRMLHRYQQALGLELPGKGEDNPAFGKTASSPFHASIDQERRKHSLRKFLAGVEPASPFRKDLPFGKTFSQRALNSDAALDCEAEEALLACHKYCSIRTVTDDSGELPSHVELADRLSVLPRQGQPGLLQADHEPRTSPSRFSREADLFAGPSDSLDEPPEFMAVSRGARSPSSPFSRDEIDFEPARGLGYSQESSSPSAAQSSCLPQFLPYTNPAMVQGDIDSRPPNPINSTASHHPSGRSDGEGSPSWQELQCQWRHEQQSLGRQSQLSRLGQMTQGLPEQSRRGFWDNSPMSNHPNQFGMPASSLNHGLPMQQLQPQQPHSGGMDFGQLRNTAVNPMSNNFRSDNSYGGFCGDEFEAGSRMPPKLPPQRQTPPAQQHYEQQYQQCQQEYQQLQQLQFIQQEQQRQLQKQLDLKRREMELAQMQALQDQKKQLRQQQNWQQQKNWQQQQLHQVPRQPERPSQPQPAQPQQQQKMQSGQEQTTVMIRNLPVGYTRDMLVDLLNQKGFAGCFDFVYMPINFRSQETFGYAFVNFAHEADAHRTSTVLQGFRDWGVETDKICEVSWSNMHQGLHAHIERYRNSPVMHESVPDQYKPAVFFKGQRVAFPAPTKRIRIPRIRRSQDGAEGEGEQSPDSSPNDFYVF